MSIWKGGRHGTNYFSTRLKFFWLSLLPSLLLGCSTPQERAIVAHCYSEALNMHPVTFEKVQSYQSVQVSTRVKGYKTVCTASSQDDNSKSLKKRSTECVNEAIEEPVYERRLVTENIDVNAIARKNQERVCFAKGVRDGMFLEKK